MGLDMAHYAFLDENNIVVQVIPGHDETDPNADYERIYGEVQNLVCKRTSYNTYGNKHREGGVPFRKNYASVGFKYDEVRDAFIPPQRFPSWTLNEETCLWEPPVPIPDMDRPYTWDEETQSWI